MLLRPTVNCTITPGAAEHDLYGQPVAGTPVPARCAVVKLTRGSQKTSVRSDSSATQGRAREIVADARLLFPHFTELTIGDKVTVRGDHYEIVDIQPRLTIHGLLDHYQVDLDVWA